MEKPEARLQSPFFELVDTAENVEDGLLDAERTRLVNGLQSGDPQAIRELFNAYVDRLYTFVFHQVGRDRSAAEDIVQDTFTGAIKSAKKFKSQSQIYTWLVSIARHKIADYYRRLERERKHNIRNQDDRRSELPEIPDPGEISVNMLESTEDKLLVEQALLKLPQDYRQVLTLKYVEELPVNDISKIMQRSPKSIEGLLSRAREMLRNGLTRDEGKWEDITTI